MKKIDHCYEYFDTDKFIKFIDAPINKECDVSDFCGIVIECIDGYNHKTGIDEGFIDLLTDLIKGLALRS